MAEVIARASVRRALAAGGVPVGRPADAHVAALVDYCDYWGVLPGGTPGTGDADIQRALDDAGVPWHMASMTLVPKAGEW